MLNTPVAYIVFNRPHLTRKSFAAIRAQRPTQLFIIADGPRPEYLLDIESCSEVRRIVEQIDWKCEVFRDYSETNLGCRKRVTTGLDWVFSQVESAIILEDDCLPEPSFFRFCSELLLRYEEDCRVGMISGNNFGSELYDAELSYSFSRHGLIWGWATWKRAWGEYAKGHQLSPVEVDMVKSNISRNMHFVEFWWSGAYAAMQGELDTWDYLWGVTRYRNNFLVVRPRVNLVANIGFGIGSTHTAGEVNELYATTEVMLFPLKHPNIVAPDILSDDALEKHLAGIPRIGVKKISSNILQGMVHLKKLLFN